MCPTTTCVSSGLLFFIYNCGKCHHRLRITDFQFSGVSRNVSRKRLGRILQHAQMGSQLPFKMVESECGDTAGEIYRKHWAYETIRYALMNNKNDHDEDCNELMMASFVGSNSKNDIVVSTSTNPSNVTSDYSSPDDTDDDTTENNAYKNVLHIIYFLFAAFVFFA
ncbi:hypothetical protein DdX_04447 [Ditylenchus destructor]|uniref:Uncharacterized protein n=1 Tax=Ditylenchus destructor TaxID=166010 RepID=A0AAD4NEX9_9BILA|nr:hypothetical protein DdX_04447 [Ditylenchus destructor]